MGVLSPEELFISPITSILLLVLVVVFLEYGSRYFQKMQELPNVEWRVLEVFTGELFDVTTRRDHLNPALGLGGVRVTTAAPSARTRSSPTRRTRSRSTRCPAARCSRSRW